MENNILYPPVYVIFFAFPDFLSNLITEPIPYFFGRNNDIIYWPLVCIWSLLIYFVFKKVFRWWLGGYSQLNLIQVLNQYDFDNSDDGYRKEKLIEYNDCIQLKASEYEVSEFNLLIQKKHLNNFTYQTILSYIKHQKNVARYPINSKYYYFTLDASAVFILILFCKKNKLKYKENVPDYLYKSWFRRKIREKNN